MYNCLNITKMKLKKSNLNKLFLNVGSAGLIALLFFGCSKDSLNINTAPPVVAGVNFIQASPDAPLINVYSNGILVNGLPLSYGSNTEYLTVNAGLDTTAFFNATTKQKIFSVNINFVKSNAYSLFLANKIGQGEVILLTDTLARPSAGSAGIRFVNVSPDAPAVDLVIKNGATLVSNKSFRGFSSFQSIPGDVTYNLEIHQAGTANVLATLNSVKLSSNYIYTFWLHGLVANTSSADQLKLDVFTNAFYL